MKKIISTLALVIGIIWQLQAQVTGFAYLSGQTDHSGIKVKFIAKSPSAKTDSTFTNADGSYSKSLKAGNYTIVFLKDTIKLNYEKGNVVFLSTNQVLSSVNIYLNRVYLSGNISGTLKKGVNYFISDTIKVPSGNLLTIEPGTILTFAKNGIFIIDGNINAIGTNNFPIKFILDSINSSNYWSGILLLNSSNKDLNKNFDFCIIQKAQTGIYGDDNWQTTFSLSNSEIMYVENCIQNLIPTRCFGNKFHHFTKSGVDFRTLFQRPTCDISCNDFYNGANYALQVTNARVFNNIVKNINGSGIISLGNVLSINNNLIDSCSSGLSLNINSISNSFGGIICNNTITNSKTSLNFKMTGGFDKLKTDFYNNLIYNTDTVLINKGLVENVKPDFFKYNLIFNYKTLDPTNTLKDFGLNITTNDNNDSIDIYANVFDKPLFSDSIHYITSSTSKTFKAGLDGDNIGYNPMGTCLEDILGIYVYKDTLTLSGIVHQATSFLKNGKVLAYNIDKNTYNETITDANGNFTFDSLATGNYVIKAIPNNGEKYLTTFFPNKSDSLSAVKINLDADISSVDIFMNSITGIDNTIGGGVITKPNPFENQLFVKVLENTSTGIQASISNAVGDVITQLSIPANENEFSINTTELPSGFYFLKVETGTKVLVQKVLKQ